LNPYQVFIVAVFIALALLVVHSVVHRGIKETIIFFVFVLLFGLIREIIYAAFFKNYSFGETPLQILGAPVVPIFGWIFTYYLGYNLCEKLIDQEEKSEYPRLMVMSAIFSSYICFSIETVALYLGWWEVFFESSNLAASDLLAGWFYSALLFFSIYIILLGKATQSGNFLLPILLIFLIAIIEIKERLMIIPSEIIIIIVYIILVALICILYPYLAIFILTLAFLFFINPTRVLFDNNTRIIVFFIVEFVYLLLLLKKPEIFETEIFKF
jgi:hypothetical protein